MEEKKILRLGAAVILCAAVLRLAAGQMAPLAPELLHRSLVFLSSGRILIHKPEPVETPTAGPEPTESAAAEPTAPPQPERPVFSREDAARTAISGNYSQKADREALLTQPLTWELRSQEPTVLILHTHGSESYENTEGYAPSSAYRTLDADYNMLSVGQAVAQRLEQAGIRVLQDRQLHDYPSYNGSYTNARKSIQQYLQENPSVLLVLDLHRDAAEDSAGRQISYTVESKYGKAAKMMMVMGMDTPARPHKNWQENLALALKLQAALEQQTPGITRPISLWASRLNQDLSAGAVLVEVGAAGNTRQEALNAANLLADAVIFLADGTW